MCSKIRMAVGVKHGFFVLLALQLFVTSSDGGTTIFCDSDFNSCAAAPVNSCTDLETYVTCSLDAVSDCDSYLQRLYNASLEVTRVLIGSYCGSESKLRTCDAAFQCVYSFISAVPNSMVAVCLEVRDIISCMTTALPACGMDSGNLEGLRDLVADYCNMMSANTMLVRCFDYNNCYNSTDVVTTNADELVTDGHWCRVQKTWLKCASDNSGRCGSNPGLTPTLQDLTGRVEQYCPSPHSTGVRTHPLMTSFLFLLLPVLVH